MSGGQQQRVAIARSLVNEHKEILLLDGFFEASGCTQFCTGCGSSAEMQLELKRLQRDCDITFIMLLTIREEA